MAMIHQEQRQDSSLGEHSAFWNMVNTQARHDHIIYLVMNLSLMGAMLLIVVNGAGQMSFDGKR